MKSESDDEAHIHEEEAAANRLYGRLGHQPDGDGVENERPQSGASGGQRPPAPRPRKNLPAAAKKINFGPRGPPKPPRNFNYALFGRDGDGDDYDGYGDDDDDDDDDIPGVPSNPERKCPKPDRAPPEYFHIQS